jgi:putative transposase
MGYAIVNSPKSTDRRYPMFPTTIQSINQAFREIKNLDIDAWEGDFRADSKTAMKNLIESQLHNQIDTYLEGMQRQGIPDRRNGYFSRHLVTELGDLELQVPRTRTFSPASLLKQLGRRLRSVERLILLAFALGLSTRKVGCALLPILGERVSAATVSRISRQLDEAVKAYHQRDLSDDYEILIFDGVVLKRKTGLGSQKRTVLVALGIRSDGKREIIDFAQASSESEFAWENFLHHLYARGLRGSHLQLIILDGGKGLMAALSFIYPLIPVQRCWAHKTRNILNYVRQKDQKRVKQTLHRISHARTLPQAYRAAQDFAAKWGSLYPKALACLQKDLPELLTFLQIRSNHPNSTLRTTNAIERRFREVRRRTRPMGTFSDHTSIDRIMFSVFNYENSKEENTPFLLTQIN